MNDKLDPFDPASLRLGAEFTDGTAVKKLLTTIPVRKPNRQDFVRVHPEPEYRFSPAAMIEFKDDREMYLVAPDLAPEMVGEFSPSTIFTAINRQGVVFLWPAKIPTADMRGGGSWSRSAETAADHAMKRWVRIVANMSLGAYEIFEAEANIPDPEWPALPFMELLRIAFRDRLVDRPDHPVILRLRGAM